MLQSTEKMLNKRKNVYTAISLMIFFVMFLYYVLMLFHDWLKHCVYVPYLERTKEKNNLMIVNKIIMI